MHGFHSQIFDTKKLLRANFWCAMVDATRWSYVFLVAVRQIPAQNQRTKDRNVSRGKKSKLLTSITTLAMLTMEFDKTIHIKRKLVV